MLKSLGRKLRQEVDVPEGSADTALPTQPAQKRKSRLTPKAIIGIVCTIVGVLLFTGVLGGSVPSSVRKVLGGDQPREYPHSAPVNQNISPTESISVGSVGEIVSVPGFEYDTEVLSGYYQDVVTHAWGLLNRGGAAEVPYFRVTVHHTPTTQGMVNEDPRLGCLGEHELRTDVPIHVRINAWAALGDQSGDIGRVNEQIAFGVLIAVQEYFEVPNEDRGGFPYLKRAFENPMITAYRPPQ